MASQNIIKNKMIRRLWIMIVVLVAITSLFIVSIYAASNLQNETPALSQDSMIYAIADAGVDRVVEHLKKDYPRYLSSDDEITLYDNELFNKGSYSAFYARDPNRANNLLITSRGKLGDDSRIVRVSIRQIPSVFKYALVANGNVYFEQDDKGHAFSLINGNVHANGDIDIKGQQVFINRPNYKGEDGWQFNRLYSPDYSISSKGDIIPASSIYSGAYDLSAKSRLDFPRINYTFYSDQNNFDLQEVHIYSSTKKDWSVSELNSYFTPTDPYTSSIIVFEEGGIRITGEGTIASTILVGTSKKNRSGYGIEIAADRGRVINLMPQSGPALIAEEIKLSGDINMGTQNSGAIVIAGKKFEIESQGVGSKKKNHTSHVVLHGALILGNSTSDNNVFHLASDESADFTLMINYTDTVLDKLPASWQALGSTFIHEEYRIEE